MDEATQRIFFALWPDARSPMRSRRLRATLRSSPAGVRSPTGNAHLTLAFLGNQPAAVVRALSASACANRRLPAFDLVVDRVESWRKNQHRLGWRAKRAAAAHRVARRTSPRSLRAVGIEPEDRPFSAHVTLARRIERSVQRSLVPPILWHGNRVCAGRVGTVLRGRAVSRSVELAAGCECLADIDRRAGVEAPRVDLVTLARSAASDRRSIRSTIPDTGAIPEGRRQPSPTRCDTR